MTRVCQVYDTSRIANVLSAGHLEAELASGEDTWKSEKDGRVNHEARTSGWIHPILTRTVETASRQSLCPRAVCHLADLCHDDCRALIGGQFGAVV
jgi:hypothetical protein